MAHVSLVTLGVDDLDAATAFYTALGWRRSSASVAGEVAFMVGGAVVLGLYGRHDLARDAGLEPAGGGHGDVALAMNVDSPRAVDDAIGAAVAAGGRVTRAAETAEWGGYSGYVSDLDGHLWEIAHNPGFPLQPDGRITLPEA